MPGVEKGSQLCSAGAVMGERKLPGKSLAPLLRGENRVRLARAWPLPCSHHAKHPIPCSCQYHCILPFLGTLFINTMVPKGAGTDRARGSQHSLSRALLG